MKTVREFIDELQKLPPDYEVIVQGRGGNECDAPHKVVVQTGKVQQRFSKIVSAASTFGLTARRIRCAGFSICPRSASPR